MPKINKNNIDLYNQNWEHILKKNAFRGYKINRMADAVVDKEAADISFKSTGNKIQISFDKHTIQLDKIASRSPFSLARIKHRIRLHFGDYKQNHNEKIKHLADLITEKLKLDKDIGSDKQPIIPLIAAFEKDNFDQAKKLIELGVNLNCVNQDGRTPLMLAAWKKQPELVKLLIESGAKVNEVVDNNGSTPLMFASQAGDIEMVELMLDAGSDVQAKAKNGSTAFHFAIFKDNNLEVINKLIDAGFDINVKDNDGLTVFQIAAFLGNLEIINKLIDAGCDIQEQTLLGMSALHIAANEGNIEVVNKLIEVGCDIHAKTPEGIMPIHLAISSEVINKLIDAGCDIDEKTQEGFTPFHLAVIKDNLEVLNNLIDAGCDIHAENLKGMSALHMAAKTGNLEIFNRLIELGVDISAKTQEGSSVLDIIKSTRPSNYEDFIKVIKIKNPDLKIRTKELKYRKQLAHAWHMMGDSFLNTEKIKLTGGKSLVWMHQIKKNIPAFNILYPNALANSELFEDAINFASTFHSNEDILSRIQNQQPTFIAAGFEGHSVTLLVWGNQFVVCNRGGASRHPIEIYHFEESAFNLKILEAISSASTGNREEYKKLFFDDKDPSSLPSRLKLRKKSLDKKLEEMIDLSNQTVGNCSWVSPITGIYAFFLLENIIGEKEGKLLAELPIQNKISEKFQQATHCYDTWHAFEQIASLEQMMKLLPEGKSPFKFDHELFQEALKKAHQLDLDPILSEKLRILTDTYTEAFHTRKD